MEYSNRSCTSYHFNRWYKHLYCSFNTLRLDDGFGRIVIRILNVVGAKNRDIRRITIIEGIIIGGVAGITGCLISEFLSYLLVTGSFSCNYSFNYRVDLIMFFSAIALTTAASLLVINNMKLEKYTELLRAD